MNTSINSYPWEKELEKTVITSLATSFGLDFLLFKDKLGGDVDTIHNVRQGVYATESEKDKYDQREAYDSKAYHQDENYINTGKNDKALQEAGQLIDGYTGKTLGLAEKGKRDLDHIKSASEVHHDPGRFLAGLDTTEAGVKLANKLTNLTSTDRSINRSKQDKSIQEYLQQLPNAIKNHEAALARSKAKLASLPNSTPEEKHQYRIEEANIKKQQEKIDSLKNIDPNRMLEKDRKARAAYDKEINSTYYTSSKFLTNAGFSAASAGLRMGTRQVLGLVLAEIWFELREELPNLLNKLKNNFKLDEFFQAIHTILKGSWERVKARFKDFLNTFKESAFAGVMASVTTTIFNIFFTTQRIIIKIIREVWGQLVKAIKLIIFNPDGLGLVELAKAVVNIINLGAATVVGSLVYSQLAPLASFPFGDALLAFISAFTTGVITLGLNYFLIYSEKAQKVWNYLNSIMPYAQEVKYYQEINEKLDNYLLEWSKLEFNFDVEELELMALELNNCNDELKLNAYLAKELEKRDIKLPFEMGNTESTKNWLLSKIK